jgi:hypothetical protein
MKTREPFADLRRPSPVERLSEFGLWKTSKSWPTTDHRKPGICSNKRRSGGVGRVLLTFEGSAVRLLRRYFLSYRARTPIQRYGYTVLIHEVIVLCPRLRVVGSVQDRWALRQELPVGIAVTFNPNPMPPQHVGPVPCKRIGASSHSSRIVILIRERQERVPKVSKMPPGIPCSRFGLSAMHFAARP